MKIIQIILFSGSLVSVHSEILTAGILYLAAASGAGFVGLNYDTIKKNTYCQLTECCTSDFIPKRDLKESLTNKFKDHLFGQHIVQEKIPLALENHFNNLQSSKKPLVISFHGTPGTGKNFVSDMIIESVYPKGLESSFVHRYFGSMNFPDKSKITQYKDKLKNEILTSVKNCPMSMFVFDEVDKMPQGLFDNIASFLDYHSKIEGVDFRKSVFIFISNNGGKEITDTLRRLMNNNGIWRDDSKLHHFESILEQAAYNLQGALENSKPIEASLIDHYVPFLPLEKKHVEKCIRAEFKRFIKHDVNDKQVQAVMNYVVFDKSGLFTTSGCKRLQKKVEFHSEE